MVQNDLLCTKPNLADGGVASSLKYFFSQLFFRHAEVMKKIIETVAEGGGELGVHMYPFSLLHGFLETSCTVRAVTPRFINWHTVVCESSEQLLGVARAGVLG